MAYRDFEEFLASLNDHDVRYLVGGAHALALHAKPRATKDLDVFFDRTKINAQRVVDATRDFFGGEIPAYVSTKTLLDPEVIVQLGVAPVRIDLISGLTVAGGFRAAWKRRVTAKFGTVTAHYLSVDDLIAEKRHFDREQDRADLVALERAKQSARRRRSR